MKTENKQYGSLYRKYRPASFKEILGQDHIVEALKRQVATGNLAHAYLFSGSRGTGKTSTALVFAKAINCLNLSHGEPCLQCENCLNPTIDIIEMDAASHNSVDDIRELREFVKFSPAKGKKKIYIVDEVHMLSNAAFNALLKTLEEPPEHIIFILATTELHMIPATVQSRCQRYDFKRVSKEGMRRRILDISEGYQVRIEQPAIDLIIRMADGSMRDTLALLEQCLSLNREHLTEELVANFFGSARLSDIIDIVVYTLQQNPLKLIETLESLFDTGVDVIDLLSAILEALRDLMVCKISDRHMKNHGFGDDERIREIVKSVEYATINRLFDVLTDISKFMRYSKNRESILEITLLKFSIERYQIDTEVKEESKEKFKEESEPADDVLIYKTPGSAESTSVMQEAKTSEFAYSEENSAVFSKPEASPNTASSPNPGATETLEKPMVPELSEDQEENREEDQEKTIESTDIIKSTDIEEEDGRGSRSKEELDRLWNEILESLSEEKLSMLKNSQIGIFVGNEMVVHIKGLSKAREMLVEMKLKADVVAAAKKATGIDCNVKFVGVDKDKATMEDDAKKVEDYFKGKGISVRIK